MNVDRIIYEVRIVEALDDYLLNWFSDVEIVRCTDPGEPLEAYTLFFCALPDQAAFFEILSRIRDLNLTIISIQKISNC